jgi:1-pyrroline-5-carboxylate dehydrogenase
MNGPSWLACYNKSETTPSYSYAKGSYRMLPPYSNEPFGDFSGDRHAAMQRALREVAGQLGQKYPLVINGEKIFTEQTDSSLNPAKPKQVIGVMSQATVELVNRAMENAHETFAKWKRVPVEARVRVLLRASAIMRRRKLELAAWMIYESNKNWAEADADVAEAIDFCEFYARQALHFQGGDHTPTFYEGEHLDYRYLPLGAGVAIPPWNFPLAIATNLVVAPLVAGNTVVFKPSERTPVIAAKLVEILEEAGLPPGVVNFVPGPGGEIGDALVDHRLTRFIGFTGSKKIGLRVSERAGKYHPGQLGIKRLILEMGGKDAIVVDESADLEAAAEGIVASAFGFQGQKCSACSRAIIVESVYDQVVQKVVERTRKLRIGNPSDPSINVGAVIDKRAFDMISSYIEIGQKEATLLVGGEVIDHELLEDGGYFIMPTVFGDVPADARIAQEEIFGPVLSITKAKDFDDALAIANGTEYGLTGAVYSNSMFNLERAREEFHVGNLYLNRKCTGALVGVHPFGGFNMSGTDSKTGGPDYLLLYMQAQSIAERL